MTFYRVRKDLPISPGKTRYRTEGVDVSYHFLGLLIERPAANEMLESHRFCDAIFDHHVIPLPPADGPPTTARCCT